MKRALVVLATAVALLASPLGSDGASAADPPAPRRPKPLDVVRSPGNVALLGGRAIVVRHDLIELRSGSTLIREIPFEGARQVTLEEVVAAVDDPSFVAIEGGVVTLRASLAQGPLTNLVVAAPGVTELRLEAKPDLFIGATQALARFDGVKVTSWRPEGLAGAGPDDELSDGRPFLLYQDGSRLDIARSELAFLGSDDLYGVGVSVRSGAEAFVVDSTISSGFVGFQAYDAAVIALTRSKFVDNADHGVVLRNGRVAPVVEAVVATGNGGDGVVIGAGATGADVHDTTASGNDGSGIVVRTDDATLTGDRVEHNGGDGIVVAEADGVRLDRTIVTGNRVGVRLDDGSSGTRLRANRLVDNQVGVELATGTGATDLVDNEIADSSRTAVVLDGGSTTVTDGVVRGSPRGFDIRTRAQVSGVEVSRVARAVVVRPDGALDGEDLRIDAGDVAVALEPGSQASVRNSVLDAPETVDGGDLTVSTGNVLPPEPFPWLSTVGVGLIVLAVVLELLRRSRERRDTTPAFPPGVWNIT